MRELLRRLRLRPVTWRQWRRRHLLRPYMVWITGPGGRGYWHRYAGCGQTRCWTRQGAQAIAADVLRYYRGRRGWSADVYSHPRPTATERREAVSR